MVTMVRDTEGKYRTNAATKAKATEIYAKWGLSLSDAINVFLVKSVEVGGLPFAMMPEPVDHDSLSAIAYKPEIKEDGTIVLPADWDDDE